MPDRPESTLAPAEPASPPQATVGGRAWRSGWGVPLLVWLLVGLNAALMLLCTVLYPANYGYDEPQHVDMAYAYAQGDGLYAPGERRPAIGVKATERGPGYPPSRPFTDTPVTARGDRSSIGELGGDAPYPLGYPNQMVSHPPLAYLLDAAVLRLPGVAALGYDKQYALLRLLGVLLLAPLPLIAFATAATVGLGRAAQLSAAVLPLAVPGLSRVGATVNNDTLLIALTSLLTLVLARVAVAADLRTRTAVAAGVLTLAALLVKGFALALPPIVAAAYLVAWRRSRVPPLRPAALALGIGCLPGSLWYLRNVLAFGALQPSGYGAAATRQILGPPRPGGTALHFASGFTDRMVVRFFGGIGLPEGPAFDTRVCWVWGAVFLVGIGVALATGAGPGRAAVLLLVAPALGAAAIVGAGTYSVYAHRGGQFAGVQGRYLYLGVVGMAVAVAAAAGLAGARLTRWLPPLLVLAAVGTQALAWRTLLVAWWVPAGARGDRWAALSGAWHGLATWSPWPAALTAVPFVLVPGLALACLGWALRGAVRGAGAPATPPLPAA